MVNLNSVITDCSDNPGYYWVAKTMLSFYAPRQQLFQFCDMTQQHDSETIKV